MKMRNIQVNRELLPMKAHYFLWNAGTGPVVPFLSVYARQLGFSSVIVGLIYMILPICGMVAKPLFGAISDRYHCQKRIFLVSQLLTAAAFLSILYSPKLDFDRTVHFSCDNSEAIFNTLPGIDIDQNILSQIQQTDGTDLCELDCENVAGTNRDILCRDWEIAGYCDNSNNHLNFIANVPVGKTLQFENTVIFKVDNVTIDKRTIQPICVSGAMNMTCELTCKDENINTIVAQNEFTDSDVYRTYQFWVFLFLMITGWVGQAIAVSIGDAICFELLGEKHNRYGYQRMFGALGWGIVSIVAGIMIDALSKGKQQDDYTSAFYMAVIFLVLDFFISSRIRYAQTKMSTSILKDVGQLLFNIRIIVYLLWCISVGMCTGLMWNFLLWLVEDLAKAQGGETVNLIKTLQGVLMGVQCLGGELPFFFLSGKILKKIGHIRAMSLVLFVIGVRFMLYSVILNPWWFIPIEFSNGLTFGLFYACMASYASIVAPPGTEATMQGLVGAVFEGVGVSLGSFLGGLSYGSTSESGLTFRYFGFGALAACFVHLVVQFFLKNKGNQHIKTVDTKDKVCNNNEVTHF